LLHVDDGAVLVEGQRLDLALEDFGPFHRNLLRLWRLREAETITSRRLEPSVAGLRPYRDWRPLRTAGWAVAAKQSRRCSRRALRPQRSASQAAVQRGHIPHPRAKGVYGPEGRQRFMAWRGGGDG